jgi:hypothetical protein
LCYYLPLNQVNNQILRIPVCRHTTPPHHNAVAFYQLNAVLNFFMAALNKSLSKSPRFGWVPSTPNPFSFIVNAISAFSFPTVSRKGTCSAKKLAGYQKKTPTTLVITPIPSIPKEKPKNKQKKSDLAA